MAVRRPALRVPTRMKAVLRTFLRARPAGVATGSEGVRYEPDPVEEMKRLRGEILDHAAAAEAAREAKEHEAEMREKVKGLTALRDSRVGK